MAREAKTVELDGSNGYQTSYTCASGTTIAKGTLLALSDPRTASAHASALQACAGICAMEKDGTDYSTRVTAFRKGVFELVASGAITVGYPVVLGSPANYIAQGNATTSASGASIIGYALETASDGETINVRLDL